MEQISKYREQSFLPTELIPKDPEFFVWYTGTLGQAEWLITHSSELRGRTWPRECPKSPTDNACINKWNELPPGVMSLMGLEQPDLMITNSVGTPLMSIEITEQQDFGSNGQQRMARFWSALANGIPSAYLLPIESYQIEEENSSSTIEIYKENDTEKKYQKLLAKQIPDSHLETLIKNKIINRIDLSDYVNRTDLSKLDNHETRLFKYAYKHSNEKDENGHLQLIDPEEYIHEVDGVYYRAYIRRPVVPGSMLLAWFEKANKLVNSCVFKLQSEYELIFQTNGLRHTVIDPKYPHLSFRNLPPYPGLSKPVISQIGKDEITLFFEYVDAIVGGRNLPDLGRGIFTSNGNYFDPEVVDSWQKTQNVVADLKSPGKSGDYRINSDELKTLLIEKIGKSSLSEFLESDFYQDLNVYKIECKVGRSMADPYSGGLAVRDLLFTRHANSNNSTDLFEFKRESGLISWITLRNSGALKNTFVSKSISANYRKLIQNGKQTDPQDQLVEIFEKCRAEQVTKDIRNFVLFCDLIFVERVLPDKLIHEAIYGLPMLMKLGKVSQENRFLASLKCG